MTEKRKTETRKEELQAKREGYLLDIHEISGALVCHIRRLKTETDPEKIKWLKNTIKSCRASLRYYIKKFMET